MSGIKKYIMTTIRHVVITALTDGPVRRVDATGLPGEIFKKRESVQHWGFTSIPVDDQSQGIMIGIGNVFYLIAEDDSRYRIAIEKGEVALYTDEGDKIHLKRGNEINITSGGTINITAATMVNIDGGTENVKGVVQGDCICSYTGQVHPMVSTNVKSSL